MCKSSRNASKSRPLTNLLAMSSPALRDCNPTGGTPHRQSVWQLVYYPGRERRRRGSGDALDASQLRIGMPHLDNPRFLERAVWCIASLTAEGAARGTSRAAPSVMVPLVLRGNPSRPTTLPWARVRREYRPQMHADEMQMLARLFGESGDGPIRMMLFACIRVHLRLQISCKAAVAAGAVRLSYRRMWRSGDHRGNE